MEVLEGDAFHERDTLQVPKFVLDWKLDNDSEEPSGLPEWLTALFSFLAWVLASGAELGLTALAVALLVYVAYRYRNELAELGGWHSSSGADAYQRPAELFGMDVTPESLPEDVIETVLRRWRDGEMRSAVALLYRATLIELMRVHAVEFRAGFTEGDCMRATYARADPECAGYFASLTQCWQLIAYAHRPPVQETLQDLCTLWPSFFRSPLDLEGGGGAA